MPLLERLFRRALVCGAGWLLATALPAQSADTVSVELPAPPGAAIPSDFLGLSFEMQRVLADTNGWHFFSAENTNLIATFRTLGIKNLRVGGNTADGVKNLRVGGTNAARLTVPTPTVADADSLFAFAKAAGVKVIFTLRLNHGDPAAAAEMAGYIARHFPQQLDCFTIGNEPNVFSTNYATYLAEWKRFAAQITAPTNWPGAKFCGPGVSPGHEKWSAQFASDLAGTGLLKFISQHDYPGGDARKFATNAAGARERILAPAMEDHYAKFAANFVPTVLSNGLAFRFEEANSFYDGGAPDASDTFASALWALHFQWWWAAHGIAGINFHTGDKVAARDENKPCRYATFWTAAGGYHVHPIGYAEKMFSLGSRGKILPVKISGAGTDLNFAAYAVAGEDGNDYVTLINQTHGGSATNFPVAIMAGQASGWAGAEVIRLTAPDGDVAAKNGVTLGGAEITDAGGWNGRWQKLGIVAGTKPVRIDLPAASAAVVKLTPK